MLRAAEEEARQRVYAVLGARGESEKGNPDEKEFWRIPAVLDCGESPGAVLAALETGVGVLRFEGAELIFRSLSDLARTKGGKLLSPESCRELWGSGWWG
jgi:hypothetical protein